MWWFFAVYNQPTQFHPNPECLSWVRSIEVKNFSRRIFWKLMVKLLHAKLMYVKTFPLSLFPSFSQSSSKPGYPNRRIRTVIIHLLRVWNIRYSNMTVRWDGLSNCHRLANPFSMYSFRSIGHVIFSQESFTVWKIVQMFDMASNEAVLQTRSQECKQGENLPTLSTSYTFILFYLSNKSL